MGTWALPQTLEQAKILQKLVIKPLSPEAAKNKLYHLLGDDDLFDLIEEAKEKDGKHCDVRALIESSLRGFLDDKENAVHPWNEEALKICQNICESLEELYIPY
jgi:hypothetical protein